MTIENNIRDFEPFKLHGIKLPTNLSVRLTDNLIEDAGGHMFGYDGLLMFGNAFVQGKRLQFTTGLPISTMLEISGKDRAKKGDTVREVSIHHNRPTVPSQSKALHDYFMDTACEDHKFILPAFTLNFGCDESAAADHKQNATLLIYASDKSQRSNGWPAVFRLPRGILLATTDGAHRREQADTIIRELREEDPEKCDLFMRNAVDLKIVFEDSIEDSHQDFADAGKAKPIAPSLLSTYDVRDKRNKQALALVNGVDFLAHYTDATASNVNLSSHSLKIWSLTAVRGFVHCTNLRWDDYIGVPVGQAPPDLSVKLADAPAFLRIVVQYLPQLHTLDLARDPKNGRTETAPTYRSVRGGDIAMRGVGMIMFSLAYLYAKKTGMPFDEVAKRLSRVDWHALKCERSELPDPKTPEGRLTYEAEVKKNIVPTWGTMIATTESRYRIGASLDDAVIAWQKIEAEHFSSPLSIAAE
jgi:hypothetical protein